MCTGLNYITKMAVFWVVAPCGVTKAYKRFRELATSIIIDLMKEAASFSETFVKFYQNSRRYLPPQKPQILHKLYCGWMTVSFEHGDEHSSSLESENSFNHLFINDLHHADCHRRHATHVSVNVSRTLRGSSTGVSL
jgi:hypothetical protein